MTTSSQNKSLEKNQFFFFVSVPKSLLPSETLEKRRSKFININEMEHIPFNETPSFNALHDWCLRVKRLAKMHGEKVKIFFPQNGGTKMIVAGDGKNTEIAAGFIRKAIIEIDTQGLDEFDLDGNAGELKKAMLAYEWAQNVAPPQLPSIRVDFKIAIDPDKNTLNKRQADAFAKMKDLFNSLGIAITHPENRPTVIDLVSRDTKALKGAELTAEWVAKEIRENSKITTNSIQQTLRTNSIQALGRDRAESAGLTCH